MVAAEEKALWWCTQTRRGRTQSLQSHCWFFSSDRAQTVKLRIEIDYNLICWCTTHTTKSTQVHLLTCSFPFPSVSKTPSNNTKSLEFAIGQFTHFLRNSIKHLILCFSMKDQKSTAGIHIKDTIWIYYAVQLCFPWVWSCWCDYCLGRALWG